MIDQHTEISSRSPHEHFCGIKCVSWSAIIAGALVGLGTSFLLNLFGIAIGLSAFTTDRQGMLTLAVGGFIGLTIGAIVSMFFAGWVAGYLARMSCFNRHFGALYGLVTWCLSLVLTIILTANAAQFMSMRNHSLSDPTSIVLTTNRDAATVSERNQSNVVSSINSQRTTVVNAEEAANDLGKSLFLTFILFFLSAVASCFGGYFGLKPNNNHNEERAAGFKERRKM
ncbi:MAG: Uncharacterized protein K0Q74_182 [Gammaproteobacteria bacterium]|jgi:MFS family permease|nr:Uncharacterized protein [Gammaproteobacteria bacterium]